VRVFGQAIVAFGCDFFTFSRSKPKRADLILFKLGKELGIFHDTLVRFQNSVVALGVLGREVAFGYQRNRALAPQLSRELNNVPITVTNRPGASGAVGATIFAKGPSDGSALMVMQATPFLANAILSGRAPVKWTDFHVINT